MNISVDEIAKYMTAVGAQPKCPVCSAENWGVIDDPPGLVWGIASTHPNGTISAPMVTVPVIVLACVQCSFVRTHARLPIEAWLSTKPGGHLG